MSDKRLSGVILENALQTQHREATREAVDLNLWAAIIFGVVHFGVKE